MRLVCTTWNGCSPPALRQAVCGISALRLLRGRTSPSARTSSQKRPTPCSSLRAATAPCRKALHTLMVRIKSLCAEGALQGGSVTGPTEEAPVALRSPPTSPLVSLGSERRASVAQASGLTPEKFDMPHRGQLVFRACPGSSLLSSAIMSSRIRPAPTRFGARRSAEIGARVQRVGCGVGACRTRDPARDHVPVQDDLHRAGA